MKRHFICEVKGCHKVGNKIPLKYGPMLHICALHRKLLQVPLREIELKDGGWVDRHGHYQSEFQRMAFMIHPVLARRIDYHAIGRNNVLVTK